MPTPVQEAQHRRDWARWRTRRLSWLIGGGAATASVVLGTLFSQLLPGHSAAASGASGAGAPAGTAGAQAGQPSSAPPPASAAPAHHRHHQAAPSQAPAPVQAPPQVVSGGS